MDNDELADVYNKALALEKSGELDRATVLYKRALEIDPDDHAGAAIRMASMGKAPAPTKAPNAYIATLFDQNAQSFDKVLVDDLGYDVPALTASLLDEHNIKTMERVLDIGCGTGLIGIALDGKFDHLTGIDLSENMLEIAYDREIYDLLYVAEANDFLEDNDEEHWDLICAADVLPYLGELTAFSKGLADNLTNGGYAVFSTETLDDDYFKDAGYVVGGHQRFAHSLPYIEKMLAEQNIHIKKANDIIVRYEQGNPIFGHLILAQLKP